MKRFTLAFVRLVILAALTWITPTAKASSCASVITTDVQGNCVTETTMTCCNGLPEGAIQCIVTTRTIYCSPIIN